MNEVTDHERATLEQLAQEYTTAIQESMKFAFLVRDTQLQLEQIQLLGVLKNRMRRFKYGAVAAKNESAANYLFHFQCGLNAQVALLEMWTQLKSAEYEEAWTSLIEAQEYVSIAMRASDGGVGLDEFMDRLKSVEKVVFPGYNVYSSIGAVIRGGQCSICGQPFGQCAHIEGLVYWGRLCLRVNPDNVRVDHSAMVKQPRDRRCIVTEITDANGRYRNYMTWRETGEVEDTKEKLLGHFRGILFCDRQLEFD